MKHYKRRDTMKKILSFFITVIIFLNILPINCFAATEEQNLWILTNNAPSSIIEFGVSFFLSCSEAELINAGFTNNEIIDLSIATPITAYEYEESDSIRYYFPIISEGKVIANITVSNNDNGTYSVQMGKTNFARNLNKLSNKSNNAIAIIITRNAIISLDCLDKLTVIDGSNFTCKNNENKLSLPELSFNEIKRTYQKKICVNHSILKKYNKADSSNQSRSIEQKTLNVPIVPNAYPGVCWASSLSSIIKYRVYIPMTEIQFRDSLVNAGYNGAPYEARNIMQYYISNNITLNSGGMLSYGTIKTNIDNYEPFYTHWDHLNISAHAMAVNGYYYNSSIPVPYGIHISLMDPNEWTYQIYGLIPGSHYSIAGEDYEWSSSVL